MALGDGIGRNKGREGYAFQKGYKEAINDMVDNLIRNSRTEIIDEKGTLIVTEERIKVIAEQMKKQLKLAEYEDAEEQRSFFQFPCKVGDTVYVIFSKNGISRYEECEVEQIIIHAGIVEMNVLIKMEHIRSRLDITLFGKTVFLTSEEAEKALAELGN